MEYKAASEVYIVDENHPWRPGYIDMGENLARLVAYAGKNITDSVGVCS
jgi:hypothetical protein